MRTRARVEGRAGRGEEADRRTATQTLPHSSTLPPLASGPRPSSAPKDASGPRSAQEREERPGGRIDADADADATGVKLDGLEGRPRQRRGRRGRGVGGKTRGHGPKWRGDRGAARPDTEGGRYAPAGAGRKTPRPLRQLPAYSGQIGLQGAKRKTGKNKKSRADIDGNPFFALKFCPLILPTFGGRKMG